MINNNKITKMKNQQLGVKFICLTIIFILVLAIISFPLAFAIYLVPYKQQSPKEKKD
jgi:ABC-type phosphate transport system permease subunit